MWVKGTLTKYEIEIGEGLGRLYLPRCILDWGELRQVYFSPNPAILNSTKSSNRLQPEERLLYIGFLASNSIWFALMLSIVKFPWKKQILSKSHCVKNTAPQRGVPEKKICYPPCVNTVQYVYMFSAHKYTATQSAASPLRRSILGYPKFAHRPIKLCSTITNP